jgi:hypothetical protein
MNRPSRLEFPIIIATAALLAASLRAAEPEADVSAGTAPVTPSAPAVGAPPISDLPDVKTSAPAPPSQNVTINLINHLVQKGILTQAEAAEMVKQSQDEAVAAKDKESAGILPPEPTPDEESRVTYIPQVVRDQMRDQIQQELMARAREENWSKNSAPEWTSVFRPFGDIRFRLDETMFPRGNAHGGEFPDFNRINAGSPYDTSASNPNYAPQLNTNANREHMFLRARFGTDIMLGEGFNAGIRIATGDTNTPISTNQTLGGSGGDFSKYPIWLDRAFISYDAGPGDGEELKFILGRFDNPFFCTQMQWDEDVAFDGIGIRGNVRSNDTFNTFFAAGFLPLSNTDFTFAANQPTKYSSNDKWLAAAQVGVEWKIQSDLTAKVAVAYYDFINSQGKLSSPYVPLSTADSGSTDNTRPGYGQNGNTHIPLRNIDNSTSLNNYGQNNQYQYYGLASKFRDLTFTGRLDYDRFDPVRISIVGELTKNLAFDVNSNTAVGNTANNGDFQGGDTAWYLSFVVGSPTMEKIGDWQTDIGYRYIESDAVIDAFNDSDFGLGGTNVQGFSLGGKFALSKSVNCALRWNSSDSIAGPTLNVDHIMFDINCKF